MSATVIGSNGQAMTSIDMGKRVRLKGDSNSPEMTIVAATANQNGHFVGWACGWFDANKIFQAIQVGTEALELVPEQNA